MNRSLFPLLLIFILISCSNIMEVCSQEAIQISSVKPTYNIGETVQIRVLVDTTSDLMLIFYTPTGTVSRNMGTIQAGIWYTVSVNGVTTVSGSYTVEGNILVGSLLYSDTDDFTVVTGGGGTPFNYELSISPSSEQVEQGKTAKFKIVATYSHQQWFGTQIDINVTGLGPGMKSSVTSTGDLSISTSSTTPTGSYKIMVVGSAKGIMKQVEALLEVIAKTPPLEYSVKISPGSQTVVLGEKIEFSIKVLLDSGESQPVSLSLKGLPDDVKYTLSKTSGDLPLDTKLVIDTIDSTSIGSYSITIVATNGGTSEEGIATLEIKESDFSLSVSPDEVTVEQGGKATFNISVDPVGKFDQQVVLSISRLPSGASSSISVPEGKPPFTSSLDISVTSSTAEGSYPIEVKAVSDDKEHKSPITLIVKAKPKQQSSLTISANSQGGNIEVTGLLRPPVGGTEIVLSYQGPNGENINRKAKVESDGSFKDTFSPDNAGEWKVTANWPGNEEYQSSTSPTTTVTAQKQGIPDIQNILSNPANIISSITSNLTNLFYVIIGVLVLVAIIVAATKGRKPKRRRRYDDYDRDYGDRGGYDDYDDYGDEGDYGDGDGDGDGNGGNGNGGD